MPMTMGNAELSATAAGDPTAKIMARLDEESGVTTPFTAVDTKGRVNVSVFKRGVDAEESTFEN